MADQCTIGVDFGTLSARAVIVRTSDGVELASAVHAYASGVIDECLPATGTPLPPEWALQDPDDYISALRHAVPAAIERSGVDAADIVGVGIDFTSCTALPTLADGTPLCRVPELRGEPHAWVKLWKHHSPQPEADRINDVARERDEPWLARYGGRYSSEWFFAKALEILHDAPAVYRATERFIEGTDWLVWQLTGVETRNSCTAGYKAMYQDGSFPDRAYFGALHPELADIVDTRMSRQLLPLGAQAGELTAAAAAWTGLRPGIPVAVANVDAHVTAAAADVTGPGRLIAIMGTSTCHVLNGTRLADVPGMCGVVDGGIIPGLYGYEAGQSGVGDIFGWFVDHLVPPEYHQEAARSGRSLHEVLSAEAAQQQPGEHGLVALDWWNGNRSVLVDTELSGLVLGMTLRTRAPDIYRALIEATAFGARVIIENFEAHGVPVEEVVVAGGLGRNELVMQIYADITGRPLSIVRSDQGPALGSAIHAAVAAGVHPDIQLAAKRMGGTHRNVFIPDAGRQRTYDRLHREYLDLHDFFGRGGNDVMKQLRELARTSSVEP